MRKEYLPCGIGSVRKRNNECEKYDTRERRSNLNCPYNGKYAVQSGQKIISPRTPWYRVSHGHKLRAHARYNTSHGHSDFPWRDFPPFPRLNQRWGVSSRQFLHCLEVVSRDGSHFSVGRKGCGIIRRSALIYAGFYFLIRSPSKDSLSLKTITIGT